MTEQLYSSDSIVADNFFTSAKPVGTREVTIPVGQNIAAREVLAMNTATGKVVTYAEAGANGTDVAEFIAPYAIDTTAAEQKVQVYDAGGFNPALLVFSGTPSDAQKGAMFAGTPIQLQSPQA